MILKAEESAKKEAGKVRKGRGGGEEKCFFYLFKLMINGLLLSFERKIVRTFSYIVDLFNPFNSLIRAIFLVYCRLLFSFDFVYSSCLSCSFPCVLSSWPVP